MRRLVAVLVGIGLGLSPCAADVPPSEYRLKAAFLYNFAKFVEWPADAFGSATAPFGLCVLGEDPFGPELESVLSGKTVAGRELSLRRLRSHDEMAGCHVLFVSAPAKELEALLAKPPVGVLTVGEAPDFVHRGGVIRFILEQGKVRFEINPDAAEKAHLKVSSKLLKLARIVR